MKKILFIHHGGIAGGAPFSMLYTMQGIRDKGFDLVVGLINPLPELHTLYNANGYETFDMAYIPKLITISGGEGKWYNPIVWYYVCLAAIAWKRAHIKLLKFIADHSIDLVHLNSVGLSNPATILRKFKIPYVWHIREHAPVRKGLRFSFIQRRLKKAKFTIFLSKAEQRSWLDNNLQGTVVHNFIDIKKFDYKTSSDQARSIWDIPKANKVILYVGGMQKHKGILPFLKALALVEENYEGEFSCLMPDTYLEDIKKANPLEKRVYAEIESTGLSNKCILMPFTQDVVNLFAACDILVFPATKPHFARPIVEAGAMKKPVVATDISVIDEIVRDGETGLLSKLDDTKDLADKILLLLRNPVMCDRLGEGGYNFVLESFELQKQTDRIAELYKIALS